MQGQTQVGQGIGVVWGLLQQLPVEGDGHLQSPRLMLGDGQLQQLLGSWGRWGGVRFLLSSLFKIQSGFLLLVHDAAPPCHMAR